MSIQLACADDVLSDRRLDDGSTRVSDAVTARHARAAAARSRSDVPRAPRVCVCASQRAVASRFACVSLLCLLSFTVSFADSVLARSPQFDLASLKPAFGGYSVAELDFHCKRRRANAVDLATQALCNLFDFCFVVLIDRSIVTQTRRVPRFGNSATTGRRCDRCARFEFEISFPFCLLTIANHAELRGAHGFGDASLSQQHADEEDRRISRS